MLNNDGLMYCNIQMKAVRSRIRKYKKWLKKYPESISYMILLQSEEAQITALKKLRDKIKKNKL